MSHARINWDQFNTVNQDRRKAFEDLCRMLFDHLFFDGNGLFHSNSNNPGVEIEPVFSSAVQKKISFQSKYFDRAVDYSQIKESAEKTVKYYNGKIDRVYLFSNLDINTSTQTFIDTQQLLAEANIELIVISNDTILDKVFNIPHLAIAYFHKHRFDSNFLQEHFDATIPLIEHRYNPQFNVVTETEESLNLFANTVRAVEKINARKAELLKRIKDYGWRFGTHKDLAGRIYTFIKELPDVSVSNISDAIRWYDSITNSFADELNGIRALIEENNERIRQLYNSDNRSEINELYSKNSRLQYVLELPDDLRLDQLETNLLQKKVLIINGESGIGKTHMLATTVANILNSGYPSMLALGTAMLTNEPFSKQIADATGLDISFDELLELLEEAGERNNCVAVLLIDAINESDKTQRWDTFLLSVEKKLKAYNHVKVAVSVRKGYEELLFDEPLKQRIKSQEILQIYHTGFREHSVESVKAFLNYYQIPFSPLDYIQYEMINPLFLKMFCLSFSSKEWDLPSLFDNYISLAEKEIQGKLGISTGRLLHNLLNEFVACYIKNDLNPLAAKDVMRFDFWDTYGLSAQKLNFLQLVAQSGIFLVIPYKDREFYSISYNLLSNYLTAKYIVENISGKSNLIDFVKHDLLHMGDDGHIHNFQAQETIGFLCGLYAEKNGEDLQELIDSITSYKAEVVDDYIYSYTWRKAQHIQQKEFFSFAVKYKGAAHAVFNTLIANSMKENHPLNVETLHGLLFSYPLVKRDAWWTIYINGFTEEDRIYQIIQLYEKGGYFDELPLSTNKLCLTLFSWLLTASSRNLRDHVSKAMIEIIKDNIDLGVYLLEKFQNVNDAYVIERLYGIVFGAVVKRTKQAKEEYKKLCDYVYKAIFCAEEVYPDILLRDYARLIIERYINEFGECEDYKQSKITPPYNSKDIPTVAQETYRKKDAVKSGWYRIDHSMIPNCADAPGMYGDFGRYTFESALNDFENVDVLNAYHFAMQFIRDVLGYDDALFGNYDTSSVVRFDRGYGGSIERIGKKYQWITFHHILARIADTHHQKSWDGEARWYDGPWELHIRDIDPTFNTQIGDDKEFPPINWFENDVSNSFVAKDSSETIIMDWVKNDCGFFFNHDKKLLLSSDDDSEWIVLHLHDKIDNKESEMFYGVDPDKAGSQEIWSISTAFFVRADDWGKLLPRLESVDFRKHSFPEANSDSAVFYGEYPWGQACSREGMSFWKDCVFKTGETHIETYEVPEILKGYGDYPETGVIENTVEDEETVCQIMPSYTHLSWGAEEDYSKNDNMALYVPCAEIIEHFKLRINDGSGSYSSPEGDLVCFDTKDIEFDESNSLVIRKDYLERFLQEKGYVMFWACFGEKQFFKARQSWSEWSGLFYYDEGKIVGKFENKSNQ